MSNCKILDMSSNACPCHLSDFSVFMKRGPGRLYYKNYLNIVIKIKFNFK